jgi:exodeoxyribonuclease VII large subunit
MNLPLADPDKVYGVSEITALIKGLLEDAFDTVWVEGEISNYKHHSSGHRYFSLKDERASIRCVMWRTTAQRSLKFAPADGQRVRALGALSVYPPHGSYQLVVNRLVDAGIGPLEIAFQKLKEKLLKEGLFDEDRKRPLPEFPSTVGVVTSPTGAAFVDITRTIAQRFPGMQVVLAPARVQGEGAAEEIVAAIRALNRRSDIDVIIAGRGGGSLEDLWPFNEEIVARVLAASRIPTIAAVGHEVDFTIADFVADYRAPTPTGAAERITDGWVQARHQLPQVLGRLHRAITGTLTYRRQQWERLQSSHALRRPADLLHLWSQRLDETSERMTRAISQRTKSETQHLQSAAGRLEALAPKAVLKRGYSITRIRGEKEALRSPEGLSSGQHIETTLSDGRIISEVTEIPDRDSVHGHSP